MWQYCPAVAPLWKRTRFGLLHFFPTTGNPPRPALSGINRAGEVSSILTLHVTLLRGQEMVTSAFLLAIISRDISAKWTSAWSKGRVKRLISVHYSWWLRIHLLMGFEMGFKKNSKQDLATRSFYLATFNGCPEMCPCCSTINGVFVNGDGLVQLDLFRPIS